MREGNDIQVREGTTDDAEDIIALYLGESGFMIKHDRLIDYLGTLPSAVARIGSGLVGFAFCVPCSRDIVEIGNILVKNGYRGSGLGRRLIVVLEAAAFKFHSLIAINSMLYDTIPGKRSAANFYLRNGFTRLWTTGPTNVYAKVIGKA